MADKYTKKNFVRDLNNDGKMDATDIVIVVNILNGKLSYFSIKLLLIKKKLLIFAASYNAAPSSTTKRKKTGSGDIPKTNH